MHVPNRARLLLVTANMALVVARADAPAGIGHAPRRLSVESDQFARGIATEPQPGLGACLDGDGRIDASTLVDTPPSGAGGPVPIRIRDHIGVLVEDQGFDGETGVSQILAYLSPEESGKATAAMRGVASLLAAEGFSEDQIRSAAEWLRQACRQKTKPRSLGPSRRW